MDLRRYTFDWDLTFAALAMHPDGTVLHRYGGRDWRGSDVWLSEASFESFLRAGVEAHARHVSVPADAEREPLLLEAIPYYESRDKGACIHCHMVFPSLREEAQRRSVWNRDDIWVYPPPERIGIDLDGDDQRRVTSVADGSPAATAGVLVRDRIVSLAGVAVAGASDVSAALHEIAMSGAEVELVVEREGVRHELALALEPGWRRGTPKSFSWRPSKWTLTPAMGFGGPKLEAIELETLGLPPEAFALRVSYLVTWGDGRRFGRAAAKGGVREGMVVLGTREKRDFQSVDHMHAWWRLTKTPGETVEVVAWSDGAERVLEVVVAE